MDANFRKLLDEMVEIDESTFKPSLDDLDVDFERDFGIADSNPYTDHKDISPYDDDIEANRSLDGEDDFAESGGDEFDDMEFGDGRPSGYEGDNDEEYMVHGEPAHGKTYGPQDFDKFDDDRAKASEIGLSKDFPDHGYDNDPWGLGEDDMEDEHGFVNDDEDEIHADHMNADDPWGLGEDEDEDNYVPDDIQLTNEYGNDARKMTTRLIDAIDEGMIDAESVASACLGYMSESQVADMISSDFDWLDDEE